MTRTLLVPLALTACYAAPQEPTTTDDTAASSSSGGPDGGDASTTGPGAPEPTTGVAASSGESSDTGDESSTGAPPEPPQPGLLGEYFGTYIDRAVVRVDPTLEFDWADGAPDGALGVDRFSARWTGELIAPATGTYTIAVESDDGVRVWIGDALVIDDWNAHFVTRTEAQVDLQAGVYTPIRVDYFEIDLAASARLLWSSATLAEQVIPADHLRAAAAPSDLPPPKPPFANPVEAFDCPDPGVLGVDGDAGPTFYKVCTGGPFPIRRSRDLVLWEDAGASVLPAGKPSWAANGNRNWAPELHRVGDAYVAYFTTVNGGNVLCIGAATAADPLGPYTESPGPLVEHPVGVIDATYVASGDQHFLVYKIDGNSQGQPTPILARELRPDGLGFADGSAEVELLRNNGNTWEGGVVEAQWIVEREGMFYMFYSGNVYDHRYRTGVARAPALLGPYEKHGAPILANNERWVGPGHGTVLTVAGLDYFVYHAWPNNGNGQHDGNKGRHVLVDRIVWDAGWPRIHDGTPSRSAQPWPGVP